jgi:hypothetical protein
MCGVFIMGLLLDRMPRTAGNPVTAVTSHSSQQTNNPKFFLT